MQVNSWVEWKRESGGMQLRREGKECRRVGRMSGEERDRWEKGIKGKGEMSLLGSKETNDRWKK